MQPQQPLPKTNINPEKAGGPNERGHPLESQRKASLIDEWPKTARNKSKSKKKYVEKYRD